MPAHNEENRIGKTLESYGKFFEDLKKKKEVKDFEIVVVLNACKDKTIDVVRKVMKNYKEIKYLNFEMGGKGFAIIEGFKYSLDKERELIGFVDADMATPPEAFYELIKNIGEHHGIIASRHKKGAIVIGKTMLGILKSKIFNFLIRSVLFIPYRDTQCGAKLFKREALERVISEIGITEWAFDVDLLYKIRKKGYKIKEIPTVWEEQRGSKLDLIRVSIRMFFSIIRLRILNSPLKDLIRMYDKMPEWIKIHHRLK